MTCPVRVLPCITVYYRVLPCITGENNVIQIRMCRKIGVYMGFCVPLGF